MKFTIRVRDRETAAAETFAAEGIAMITEGKTQNANETSTIARAIALRGPAQALGLDIGNTYALALSRGWKRHGVAGVRAACWDLAQLVAETPGGWGVYVAARAIAEKAQS